MKPLRIAITQLPITGDILSNGERVRTAMREAVAGGARLIQFPEGMLTGYAKHPILDWSEVDWRQAGDELERVQGLAAELKLWVVLGSAHRLAPGLWPRNSLYIISDAGMLVGRYDKRVLSHTEATRFYSAGSEPVVFEVDGYRLGCMICIEINFPVLWTEYADLDVDGVLLSAYPEAKIFYTKARAHAATQCYWVALSAPSDTVNLMHSGLIGPNGETLTAMEGDAGLVIAELDRNQPELDLALHKAKPWRAQVRRNLL